MTSLSLTDLIAVDIRRIPRVYNWGHKLTEFIMDLRRSKPQVIFDWDASKSPSVSYNCMTFLSAAVEVQTGVSLYTSFMKEEATNYTDARGAAKSIIRLGYHGLPDVLSSLFLEKPKPLLHRGDLGLVRVPDSMNVGSIAGVLMDPPYYWVMTYQGIQRGVASEVIQGYHVGA